jgi:hypothetical protein
LLSQLLTLYTTPVVYLLLGRLARRGLSDAALSTSADEPEPLAH